MRPVCLFRARRLSRCAKITLAACGALALLLLLAAARVAALPAGCRTSDLLPSQAMPTAVFEGAMAPTEKIVYLTFDDGPSSATQDVLDVLRDEGVPATFFVVSAENNQRYLPLVRQAQDEGHLIALHSASHSYSRIYKSAEAFWQDIEQLKSDLASYTDTLPAILRFPGGSTNTVSRKYGGSEIMTTLKREAKEKGYTYVDWNVCAGDALGGHPSAEDIYNNVVREAADQDVCIVLMHDTKAAKSTVTALPRIIQWFKNAGYRFDTVDHLPAEA